ncbi:NADH:flavin oxidoreductase [Tsukamurella sp. 8F]|uniref:oxidoreductase n=1 Tax=unclassified Tsukamurella TaxID=2633480 RepID=UPI0023B95481|nr:MULTISPECIES: NADH:flavin oxidoreductase [unclassified Tsukamurella]MDF0531819.1 NADH:flavin oxidoreductase [Tsukamurella sp. 8J]MDF0589061.1 NADH:flavin oxidoreductase [Tsukamurella sp. 8F]
MNNTTSPTPSTLSQPLTLPCGTTLKNRIAKAAMSETLADRHGVPTARLQRLYDTWARGGAGLLITGNVMIDHRALVEPRNVILEDPRHRPAIARWAAAAHAHHTTVFMQLNHPGRVAAAPWNRRPVGPSTIRSRSTGARRPRAMTTPEIAALVRRFAHSAQLAVDAGFDGVQIHAAHGYILSQFLAPNANTRGDRYGGDPGRRRSLLLDVIHATRETIGPTVALSVKLNCADFDRGGLSEDESLDTAVALADSGIDLLEISGGTYADPAMFGPDVSSNPHPHDYFLPYAQRLRARTKVPIMLTGGMRTAAVITQLIDTGVIDVVGLARPLAVRPDLPTRILVGDEIGPLPGPTPLGRRNADGLLQTAWHAAQLRRVANQAPASPDLDSRRTLLTTLARTLAGTITQGH